MFSDLMRLRLQEKPPQPSLVTRSDAEDPHHTSEMKATVCALLSLEKGFSACKRWDVLGNKHHQTMIPI